MALLSFITGYWHCVPCSLFEASTEVDFLLHFSWPPKGTYGIWTLPETWVSYSCWTRTYLHRYAKVLWQYGARRMIVQTSIISGGVRYFPLSPYGQVEIIRSVQTRGQQKWAFFQGQLNWRIRCSKQLQAQQATIIRFIIHKDPGSSSFGLVHSVLRRLTCNHFPLLYLGHGAWWFFAADAPVGNAAESFTPCCRCFYRCICCACSPCCSCSCCACSCCSCCYCSSCCCSCCCSNNVWQSNWCLYNEFFFFRSGDH